VAAEGDRQPVAEEPRRRPLEHRDDVDSVGRALSIPARPLSIRARPLSIPARPLSIRARPLSIPARPLGGHRGGRPFRHRRWGARRASRCR
jgi:hypothetical protein